MHRWKWLLSIALTCGGASANAAWGGYFVDAARARLDDSEQRVADAEYELSSALAARDVAAGQRDDAQNNLVAARGAHDEASNRLATDREKAKDLSAQLSSLTPRIEHLQGIVERAEREFDVSAKVADDLYSRAAGPFEASPSYRDAIRSVRQHEARLDGLYAMADSSRLIGDWFLALPQIPADPIIHRALSEHQSAVDAIERMRADFEADLKKDPAFAAADAAARIDADALNARAAELRDLEIEREDLQARLDQIDRDISAQEAAVAQIQRDVEQWEQRLSLAESALNAAEQRVQFAASDAAGARQERDLAYAEWRQLCERETVVVVPADEPPYYYGGGQIVIGGGYDHDRDFHRHYDSGGDRWNHDQDRDRDHREDREDRHDGRDNSSDDARVIREREHSFRDGKDDKDNDDRRQRGEDRERDDRRPAKAEQHRRDDSPPPSTVHPPHDVNDRDRERPRRSGDTDRSDRFRSSDRSSQSSARERSRSDDRSDRDNRRSRQSSAPSRPQKEDRGQRYQR